MGSKPEERLKDSQKYVVIVPYIKEEVRGIISDVSKEYGLGSASFALDQDTTPFDLNTAPELSQTVLEALRERGMRIKRYEY
jgi:hypothetical protein